MDAIERRINEYDSTGVGGWGMECEGGDYFDVGRENWAVSRSVGLTGNELENLAPVYWAAINVNAGRACIYEY
jgi:hypothetical protein